MNRKIKLVLQPIFFSEIMIEPIFAVSAFIVALISVFLLVELHKKKKLIALNYSKKEKVILFLE